MTTQPVFFDIETGPLPLSEIEQFKPEFKAPANYKDVDKIKASIMEQEAKWLADGALSAVTGKILVIGTLQNGFNLFVAEEGTMLLQVMGWMQETIQAGGMLVGFCSRTFDVPFLIRRAYRHGLKVPSCFWEGHYLNSAFVDVAERWACGGREPRDRISLDHLSKFLGTGKKLGEGKDFAALWQSDRDKALEYLKRDLELTKLAYERLYL